MDVEIHKVLLKKAGALLARRAYSRGELRNRLAKIAGDRAVESALDRLEQLNLLNDADYAYNFAFCRIKQQGWGPARVHESLLRRHVAETAIACALQRIRNEFGDESLVAEYIQKHCGKTGLPSDLKGIRKLVSHLRQRGFDEDLITNVLKRMIPAESMPHFERGE
jgi:regulatory protein